MRRTPGVHRFRQPFGSLQDHGEAEVFRQPGLTTGTHRVLPITGTHRVLPIQPLPSD